MIQITKYLSMEETHLKFFFFCILFGFEVKQKEISNKPFHYLPCGALH